MSRVAVKLATPKPAKAESKGRACATLRQGAKPAQAPSAAALKAAAAQPTRALPHRAVLEQRFGRGLGQIRAVQGPTVTRALDAAGAEAATLGDRVMLRPEAPLGTVAHETAHALQPERAAGGTAARAEAEAHRAERQATAGGPVAPPQAARVPGMVAFKVPDSPAGMRVVPKPDPAAAKAFRAADRGADAPKQDVPARDVTTPQPTGQTQAAPAAPTRGSADDAAGAGTPDQPVPTFAAPTIPALEVDTDAAQAAADAADAKIAAAKDAGGMMAAFRAAPPSLKARRHDQLSGNARTLAEADQAQFDRDLPSFEAKLSGADDLAPLPSVGAPAAETPTLEAGTPAPAPEPVVDPTPAATATALNPGGATFAGIAQPGDAASMGAAFAKLSTSDKRIETSAGTRPTVPTSGETDPARVAAQDTAARGQADTKQQAASQAVLEGRGPDEAKLRSLHEEIPATPRALPEAEAVETAAPGAVAFREGSHDAEVTALFDAHHNGPMAESLAQAEADTGAAVAKRNSDRDAKLAEARTNTDRLNRKADEGQRAEVLARRKDIQTARGKAVADQKGHVDALKTQAELDRKAAKTEVDSQITTTDAQVAKDFTKAEGDAQAEVTAGEAKAETERTRQKANAEKQSWWDRAKSWVQAQFDKLTKFINGVFDAVRKAVKKLIDAVKTAALKLIDAAAKAIKSAIEKLGKALKKAVTALLEKHFPEVAKALNAAIDKAVAAAKTAVDRVASGLKKAVTAVLDTLAKGIDAILALYQKAINAALNLAKIALTADWGALAKMVLEPILLAFGIKPAEFYALIGKAIGALDIIVKNPAGFIKNLVKTVVGGLKLFGGKLFEHLQKGIIGWLTGALGSDLKIPKTWSLFGVLDLARQIMGLTLDFIRRIAVRVLGEKAVTVIEQVMGTIATFVKGGFAALWEQIKGAVGNLKSLVLEQIKSFLLERVLLASVTWLASLFNPAGAIAKLIMMTWNLLMFLKDQLGRMVDLLKKVFGTLYEIATGVLEPAQKGVEAVLGRTLPLVIDLFARLLGLGNVAGRVKKIIDGVRQKIEDAIVKLIKRIAGRGKGKKGKKTDQKGKPAAKTLKPIVFKGGGQQHTLFIKKKGKDAKPMMRSKEMPVEKWLKSLEDKVEIGKVLASQHRDWRRLQPATRSQRVETAHKAVGKILTRAKAAEDALDTAADAATSPQTPKQKQQAAQSAMQAKATRLAATLEDVLDAMGVTKKQLNLIFAKDIRRLSRKLQTEANDSFLRPLPYKDFATLSWPDAIAKGVRHSATADKWKRPFHSTGILRSDDFKRAYDMHMRKVIRPVNPALVATNDDYDAFHKNYLTSGLAEHQVPVIKRLLSGKLQSMTKVLAAYDDDIEAIAKARADGADTPDQDIKAQIKASNIKGRMLNFSKDPSGANFTFYPANDGKNGVAKNLYWFFGRGNPPNHVPRAAANKKYLGNMVRTAPVPTDRPHEFIKSADVVESIGKVTSLVTAAQGTSDSGKIEKAIKIGQTLFLWQYHVRAPTYSLVFKPKGDYPKDTEKVTVPYISAKHRHHFFKHGGDLATPLNATRLAAWYKSGQEPGYYETVSILQAHSGGLYAHVSNKKPSEVAKIQSVGSPGWHGYMKGLIDPAITTLTTTGKDTAIGQAIFKGYKETIWDGTTSFSDGGDLYPEYYLDSSETNPKTFAELKSNFAAGYQDSVKEIEKTIGSVRDEVKTLT